MERSKRRARATTRHDSTLTGDELIRHHLEEAVVHLRAAYYREQGNEEAAFIDKVCKNLKKIYVRHGGIDPDARPKT